MHYERVRRNGIPGPAAPIVVVGDDQARFDLKVDRSGGPDACHPWLGTPEADGYGRFRQRTRNRTSHAVAWELAHGEPVPEGHDIDHECHNEARRRGECHTGVCPHRLCCNPAHLVARTRRDHIHATDRGEPLRGSANGFAVLTEADIPQIRADLAAGLSLRIIGLKYGVSPSTIREVKHGRIWTHVA